MPDLTTGSAAGSLVLPMAGGAYPTAPGPVPRVRMRVSVLIGLILFFVGMVGAAALSLTGDLGDTIVLSILAVIGIILVTRGGAAAQKAARLPSTAPPAASMDTPGAPPAYPPGAGGATIPLPPPLSASVPAPPPPPPPGWAPTPTSPFCTGCGRPTTYLAPYGRFYCYACARYA